MRKAIQIPCKTIAENAGHEGAIILGKLLESKDEDLGFNAQKGEFCNMIEAGIIDPTKVVRTALVDAASVASLMTTTEVMIVDIKEDKPTSGGGNPMEGMY